MTSSVYIIASDINSPVYHKEHMIERKGGLRVETICGRSSSFSSAAVRLPRQWAVKFAEQCEECFPT